MAKPISDERLQALKDCARAVQNQSPYSDDDIEITIKWLPSLLTRRDLAEQRVKQQADEIERLRKAIIDLIDADAWPFDKMRAARKQAREILDGK